MTSAEDNGIVFEKQSKLGVIRLNRPKALNALNTEMCRLMHQQLLEYQNDPEVAAIWVEGEGDKAFCAGGDIAAMREASLEGDVAGYRRLHRFFSTEYRLNHAIFHCSKPYIAILDGVTMGGGVGISIHGSYRVATERTLFAMPETGIGLFPDVGSSYQLPRLPGEVGMFLALTGQRLRGAQACEAGIANYYVESVNVGELKDKLTSGDLSHLKFLSPPTQTSWITEKRRLIDQHFAGASVEAIMESLESTNDEWCLEQAETIRRMSPRSLKVTFELMRRGRDLTLEEGLVLELRLALRCTLSDDFREGVRAQIIDKDRCPKWSPAELSAVKPELVAAYFEPLVDKSDELTF